MSEVVKRRFIAGARCPQCAAEDRLQRVEYADGAIVIECRACGMARDLADPPAADDPPAAAPVVWKKR